MPLSITRRIDLTGCWLAGDRADRIVYRPGRRFLTLYGVLALVLGFLAAMAYPRNPRPPTARDQRTRRAVDQARADALRRGEIVVLPALPAPKPTPNPLRPWHIALAILLSVAAWGTVLCALHHRVVFTLSPSGDELVFRYHLLFGSDEFRCPLAPPRYVRVSGRAHHRASDGGFSSQPTGRCWSVDSGPTCPLPQLDVAMQPLDSDSPQTRDKARQLATRLAEMTQWPLQEPDPTDDESSPPL